MYCIKYLLYTQIQKHIHTYVYNEYTERQRDIQHYMCIIHIRHISAFMAEWRERRKKNRLYSKNIIL